MSRTSIQPLPHENRAKAEALTNMDLLKIMRSYLGSIVEGPSGYKGLVLDTETMRICSTLYGRTELSEKNVVHVECLDKADGRDHSELTVCASPVLWRWVRWSPPWNQVEPSRRDPALHVQAVCFLRPTRENITLLKRELKQPRYQHYHLREYCVGGRAHAGAAGTP